MGYFDRKGEVPVVERVSDDVRAFLTGLRERGNGKVAGLSLEWLRDPLGMPELQWQIFMDRCKLSPSTKRHMEHRRKAKLAMRTTKKGPQHWKYKRRMKRELMRRYRARRATKPRLLSELLYRIRLRAKRMKCSVMSEYEFYDVLCKNSEEWNKPGIVVSFQLVDKTVREFSLNNTRMLVDAREVYAP